MQIFYGFRSEIIQFQRKQREGTSPSLRNEQNTRKPGRFPENLIVTNTIIVRLRFQ